MRRPFFARAPAALDASRAACYSTYSSACISVFGGGGALLRRHMLFIYSFHAYKCVLMVFARLLTSTFQVNSYQNTKTKESLTLDYVACLMQTANSFKDTIFPGAKCARELQLPNWNVIEECANSTEGSKLLQSNGERTHSLNPELSFVPTITFNHVRIAGNASPPTMYAYRTRRAWVDLGCMQI